MLWRNLDVLSKRNTIDKNAIRCKIIFKFPDTAMRWVLYYISQACKDMIYKSKDLLDALSNIWL